MTLEDRIYEKLRAHRATSSYNIKSVDSTHRDDRRGRTRGEYQERLTDLSTEEVKNLLLEEKIAKKYLGFIGQGKEANIYWIKDMKNRLVAIKMFRIHSTSHNFNAFHAKSKLSDTAKLGIASGLCQTEYMNLHHMFDAGMRVPRPLFKTGFIYGMEFLGDKKSASPLLLDVDLRKEGVDPLEVMDDILNQLDIMFNKAQMVHGDFSEHNIIWHYDMKKDSYLPYIIDVLQSQRYHPKYATGGKIRKRDALKVLKKDINGILNHFKSRYRISYDPEVVFENIPDEKIDDWMPDQLMSEVNDPQTIEEEDRRFRLE